jgi:hypothetical protein
MAHINHTRYSLLIPLQNHYNLLLTSGLLRRSLLTHLSTLPYADSPISGPKNSSSMHCMSAIAAPAGL